MADWTPSQNKSEDKKKPDWIIYCDGAWGFAGPAAAKPFYSDSEKQEQWGSKDL